MLITDKKNFNFLQKFIPMSLVLTTCCFIAYHNYKKKSNQKSNNLSEKSPEIKTKIQPETQSEIRQQIEKRVQTGINLETLPEKLVKSPPENLKESNKILGTN